MKIAILTKSEFSSPRVLAESLQSHLVSVGVEAEIFFEVDMLNRLVRFKNSKLSFHYWLIKKVTNWSKDKKLLKRLKEKDAVVVSECIPNAYWRHLYNVEKLKRLLKKPVLIYEVYALHNAPTQIERLRETNNYLAQTFDGHLYISPVTERREKKKPNAFEIGLFARKWRLAPEPKRELVALLDFAQPGFEVYRKTQEKALKKAGIKYISLEKKYTIAEIRDIYREVSLYFMQSFEAFGLPILECLCAGAQIYTSNSAWPMSWRLDENPSIHGEGTLPNCFTVYEDENDLLEKLLMFKENFNRVKGPMKVFDEFIKNYPFFYHGNDNELKRCLNFIDKKGKRVG